MKRPCFDDNIQDKVFDFFTNVLSCYRQLIRIHLKENHIMSKKPVVLMVLDGYGLNDRTEG